MGTKIKRLTWVLLVILLWNTTAYAQNVDSYILKTSSDGIYEATLQINESSITFPVYCMNRNLKWPDTTLEYTLFGSGLSQDVQNKVKRILFAGYPTNGMNYYTIGEAVEVTMEDLETMLNPPSIIVEYEYNGSKPFGYMKSETYKLTDPDLEQKLKTFCKH